MSDERSVPATVDAAVDLVGAMSPGYTALSAVASLPWRMGVATLAGRALELGSEATNVAPYWASACAPLAFFFALHVFGQLVFVRAALLTVDEGGAPLKDTLKSAVAAFPSVLYVSALTEAAFFLTALTLMPPFILWAVSGAVLGAHPTIGAPSLLGPFKALAAERSLLRRFVVLHALLFLIMLVVLVNIGAVSEILPGLLGLIPGFPVETVVTALSRNEMRVLLGLWAMAAAVIEPVRLAASTVLCFERTARHSGRDLRARLRVLSLRTENA